MTTRLRVHFARALAKAKEGDATAMGQLGESVKWDAKNLRQIVPVIFDALCTHAPPPSYYRDDAGICLCQAALNSLADGIKHAQRTHRILNTDPRFSFLIDGWTHIWKWLHFFWNCAIEGDNSIISILDIGTMDALAMLLHVPDRIAAFREVAEQCDGYARTQVRVWASAARKVLHAQDMVLMMDALSQLAISQQPIIVVLQRILGKHVPTTWLYATAILRELREGVSDILSFGFDFLSLMVRISSSKVQPPLSRTSAFCQTLEGAMVLLIFLNDWQDHSRPRAVSITDPPPVFSCQPRLLPLIVNAVANMLIAIKPQHSTLEPEMAKALLEVTRLIPDFLVAAINLDAVLVPLFSQCIESGLLIVVRRMQLHGQCPCRDERCPWSLTPWNLRSPKMLEGVTGHMDSVLFKIGTILRAGSYQIARSIQNGAALASQDSWTPGSAGNLPLRAPSPQRANRLCWDSFCLLAGTITGRRIRYRWCHPLCLGLQCHSNRDTIERPMKCGGCLQAYYCSRVCQKAHRRIEHYRDCDKMRAEYQIMGGETRLTNADLAFGEWYDQCGSHQAFLDLCTPGEQQMIKLPKNIRTEPPNWDRSAADAMMGMIGPTSQNISDARQAGEPGGMSSDIPQNSVSLT